MSEMNSLTFNLTPEEVAALYEHLAGPGDEVPYADLLPFYDEAQRALAVQVAHRSLLARQLLWPDDEGGHQAHPLVLMAAFAHALAERTLVIRRQNNRQMVDSLDAHVLPDRVFVLNRVEPSGLRTYQLLDDATVFSDQLLTALALMAPPTLSWPDIRLADDALQSALSLAQQGEQDKAVSVLREAGLPPKTAERLAETWSGPLELKSVVTLAGPAGTQPEPEALTFLQGDGGLWLLESQADEDRPETVLLRAVTQAEARQTVWRKTIGES